MRKAQVGIVMGSDSDLEVMTDAAKVLDEVKIAYELSVLSAHRTPEETASYAKNAQARGLKVIIAGAGGAAALPGSIAAQTILPVIGVPIKSKSLEGLDALLSIVQMPPGIPVACVSLNGAKNAGLLAAEIIAVDDPIIREKIALYRKKFKEEVLSKNTKLKKIGWTKYLKEKSLK
ncbi:MAG: 5-(Carboxyamino)imidazole ribonucleotide mutase [uncultured bacterium]|uniref:N5-carboxyaminoimidazole ribonucleotide mutase n=1 Tax=Candidatus Curtissbacteria bacterium RIFOXYA1_FULL_41_14 TaxID=1797737 RepID=A0A1F5HC54_9BACT|nr:MAG: 5-(Carboxyamino)imidazole ribonucleotide mutase [uncultured bacterium]KKR58523.1 MAG: N5-carboxyaminoimidazole ribonucleotide mutase [Candidatus Curtissbacteria bacterium GW2011_GWB1_40_28]KKR60830.1 MAG: N5-carboxyaminoimidazole ribonucleotide mutase [Candidatus Curtissbacteria bacterium GW2011_GWA2_40_31]KKR62107.1 MAG: N5-carboxyaminoimidazole ribonucleotide mutase [Microgenomates group bacterium GW2011_GWC1_40_35]KKR65689.1 MAG: N5-carboxyaminoimidazole ribonucleotide mutase [Candid